MQPWPHRFTGEPTRSPRQATHGLGNGGVRPRARPTQGAHRTSAPSSGRKEQSHQETVWPRGAARQPFREVVPRTVAPNQNPRENAPQEAEPKIIPLGDRPHGGRAQNMPSWERQSPQGRAKNDPVREIVSPRGAPKTIPWEIVSGTGSPKTIKNRLFFVISHASQKNQKTIYFQHSVFQGVKKTIKTIKKQFVLAKNNPVSRIRFRAPAKNNQFSSFR